MVTPVAMEPLLGYHPCSTGFLTSSRDPAGGQCQVGSLTGAVASERVSEALKGSLRMLETIRLECKGRRELDCDTDGWSRYDSEIARYKVGLPSLNG